jgi:hypothetical protein
MNTSGNTTTLFNIPTPVQSSATPKRRSKRIFAVFSLGSSIRTPLRLSCVWNTLIWVIISAMVADIHVKLGQLGMERQNITIQSPNVKLNTGLNTGK